MIDSITQENLGEYEEFISNHPKGHFMQSSMWAAVKSDWKWEAFALRDTQTGRMIGAMSMLIRKFGAIPYTLAYSGRGPVCDVHDEDTLFMLMSHAKEVAKKNNAYVLKIDPDILSSDTDFCNNMHKFGFSNKSIGQNFEGIQPRYVFRLDISGKTEQQLMDSFHQKTRYNIRLAERKGVCVKKCGTEAVPDFAELMRTTGLRDGFVTRPKEYFIKILEKMGEHAELYMAYSAEGVPIAGTLAIFFGNKAWYLYGASSNEHRNLMPNYLLQWTMIRRALEKKCAVYDFRGVSGDISEDNPLYGLYKFKKGFGGDFCEFAGEFEYSPHPAAHYAIEKGSDFYRAARRRVYLFKEKRK